VKYDRNKALWAVRLSWVAQIVLLLTAWAVTCALLFVLSVHEPLAIPLAACLLYWHPGYLRKRTKKGRPLTEEEFAAILPFFEKTKFPIPLCEATLNDGGPGGAGAFMLHRERHMSMSEIFFQEPPDVIAFIVGHEIAHLRNYDLYASRLLSLALSLIDVEAFVFVLFLFFHSIPSSEGMQENIFALVAISIPLVVLFITWYPKFLGDLLHLFKEIRSDTLSVLYNNEISGALDFRTQFLHDRRVETRFIRKQVRALRWIIS